MRSSQTSVSLLPQQCRAARAYLDLSQAELAERARVRRQAVIAFETGTALPRDEVVLAIRAALEAAGADFLTLPDGRNAIAVRPR